MRPAATLAGCFENTVIESAMLENTDVGSRSTANAHIVLLLPT
jgi:hypothetical protein